METINYLQRRWEESQNEQRKNQAYWQERSFRENDKVREYLRQFLSAYEEPKILDVGGGIFWQSYIPEEYWEKTTTVDWAGNPDIKTDIERGLPLANESFEVIILKQVPSCLKNWEEILPEMQRILKKNGSLTAIEFEGYLVDEKTRFSIFDPEKVKEKFGDMGLKEIESQVVDQLNTGRKNKLTAVSGKK